ncbi:Aste57867_3428 [Aphanomyces stellatus]|uniref:Aste57867_3428 protein n=1 Tax=Aphanomyces stellatus TaxID=120398 RepID=A0A485K9M2_9STRA|nr:hypothetical protein As57867_003418 [Aphanomyces stellatus]VFT80594.1 Aste57867_3428 [Aphanomyces stellatus]
MLNRRSQQSRGGAAMDESTALLLPPHADDLIFSACWLVEDAFLSVSRPKPVATPRARRIYAVHSECALLARLTLYFLVILAFIETPHWCDESKAAYPCGDPADPATPMTFQMNYLTYPQSRWIEACCLVALLIHSAAPYMYLQNQFLSRLESKAEFVLLVVSLVDLSLLAASSAYNETVGRLRIHEYIRIALVVTTHTELRRSLRKILAVLSEIYSILSLVFVFILFYAWMSIVLFSGTPEGKSQMPNMIEASWNFMILLTASNFPDIMMLAYNENRTVCLFFILFVCFGLFFLMNVVLAVIVNNFSRYTEAETTLRHGIRVQKLTQAFNLLDQIHKTPTADGIPLDVCVRMFEELNHCNNVAHIQKSKMREVFEALDTSGDDEIQLNEFLNTCDVLEGMLFADDVHRSEVEVCCPVLHASAGFQAFGRAVHSKHFEWFIDVVLALNAVLIVVQSGNLIDGDLSNDEETVWQGWDAVEWVFTALYVFEMLAKLVVDGVRRYWASVKNRFDCIITVAVVAVDLYTYYGAMDASPFLVRIFMIARCLRLFRLIVNIKGYRLIFTTWFRLLRFGIHLLMLLFCQMYIFALLGNQLFGGLISPAVMHTQFPDHPYTAVGYMANNFNDMPGAMVTLFELVLVNNWYVIADGHVAVTNKFARWFFISYHLLGVNFLLNLVVASILDAFIDEYKTEHAKPLAPSPSLDDSDKKDLPQVLRDISLAKPQASSYGST